MSLGGNMAGLLSRDRVLSTQIGFDEQRITVRPTPSTVSVSQTIKLTKPKIDWLDFITDDLV